MDGRIVPLDEPAVCADDGAFAEGRGCYTSARISGGRARFAERHARRLRRDARALRIGEIEEADVLDALAELAARAFPDGEGVVRLGASRDGRGLHLVGVPRALGDEPAEWRAIVVPFAHPGALPYRGHKVTNRLLHAWAAEEAEQAGAEEAVLVDAEGRLVEGARSNLFIATASGELCTPTLERGGVAGIAREVVLERVRDVVERDVGRDELAGARELVAVNAVRGACAITTLDGLPLGKGHAGPEWKRLAEALARD